MDSPETQEYKELSQDRRAAVDIFLKGFLIAAGLMAFGFKLLMDSKDSFQSVFIGGAGVVICLIAVPYWVKCRNHDRAIHKRLLDLTAKLGISPVISTHYIFNVAFLAAIVVAVSWLGMTAWTIMKLKP